MNKLLGCLMTLCLISTISPFASASGHHHKHYDGSGSGSGTPSPTPTPTPTPTPAPTTSNINYSCTSAGLPAVSLQFTTTSAGMLASATGLPNTSGSCTSGVAASVTSYLSPQDFFTPCQYVAFCDAYIGSPSIGLSVNTGASYICTLQ
jgi:hypothetical protein